MLTLKNILSVHVIKIYSLIHRYRQLDTIAEDSFFNKLGRLILCQPFFLNKPHTHNDHHHHHHTHKHTHKTLPTLQFKGV